MKTNQVIDIGNSSTSPDGTVTITRNVGGDMVLTDGNAGALALSAFGTSLATHAADTTAIHGIANTANLVLTTDNVNVLADVTAAGADIDDAVTKKHLEAHTVASHSDTTATGAELETLTDSSNADALHTHTGFVAVGGDTMTGTLVISGVVGTPAFDLTGDGIAGAAEFHIEIGAADYWRGDGDLKISGDLALSSGQTATIETIVAVDATGLLLQEVTNNLGITIADTSGDVSLDSDFAMLSGKVATIETVQAVDATGLQLFEDGGLGLTIADATGDGTFDGDLNINGGGLTGVGLFTISTNNRILLQSAGSQDMFFDCGDEFLWRDKDDVSASRMTLNSDTAELKLFDGSTAGRGGFLTLNYRSADAPDPGAGLASLWFSDGTGSGANGDLMMISNNGVSANVRVVQTHA